MKVIENTKVILIFAILISMFISLTLENSKFMIIAPKCKTKSLFNDFCEIGDYQFLPPKKKVIFKSKTLSEFQNAMKKYKFFPEINQIENQTIKLLSPSKKFPNHPRTIFFENEETINPKHNTSNLIINNYTITDKQYMVVFKAYLNVQACVNGPLTYNNLIKVFCYYDPNLIYRLLRRKERKELTNSLSKYQRFNHFPFCAHIHNKSILYQHFEEMQKKFPEDYNYMPKSYILPLTSEEYYKNFLEYSPSEENMWIIKPSTKSRGRGIKILEHGDDIPESGVLSKYVSHPFLVEGRKFDLRLYVLVTGFSPLKIYLYNNGLVRFAGDQYNIDTDNFANNFVHLTNYEINKNSPNWEFNDSLDQEKGLKWTIIALRKHLKERGIDFNQIWKKIKDVLIKIFISYNEEGIEDLKNFQVTSTNLFELFGVDILIDKDFKPWLMEVNMNPSLNTDSGLDLKLKSGLLNDIFNIIGLVPFSHSETKESMEPDTSYESPLQESIYETFCEFERPQGNFERIFPLKSNIDKYKKLFSTITIENEKVWEYMKKFDYE